MHQDFKELLSAFNAEQVRYLIVGGYAVSFHAQPRATKDLDILIGSDAENSNALLTGLKMQDLRIYPGVRTKGSTTIWISSFLRAWWIAAR
jgi:hypothetical protein